MRDAKAMVREKTAEALRAALVVTSQREAREIQRLQWYKQCYDEGQLAFDDYILKDRISKDDRTHGCLLIMIELLRVANSSAEKLFEELKISITNQPSKVKSEPKRDLKLVSGFFQDSHPDSDSLNCLEAPVLIDKETKFPLVQSSTCTEIIAEHYDLICTNVLAQRNVKNANVQSALLRVIPKIAAFDSEHFCKNYLSTTMNYLLGCLTRKDRDKANTLATIGILGVVVEGEILSYLPSIMDYIKSQLPMKDPSSKRKQPFTDPSVFVCLSLLARALKQDFKQSVSEILDSLFLVGLSHPFTSCMKEIVTEIPTLKKSVCDGLLQMLSMIIMKHPLKFPGYQRYGRPAIDSQEYSHDTDSVVLALRTLARFDFETHWILQFLTFCADNLLSHDHLAIRRETARTCCKLLSAVLIAKLGHKLSATMHSTATRVIAKLLVLGITEPQAQIRLTVLTGLDKSFYPFLAQAENLSYLFIALNDEVFEVREVTISLIGNLSTMNPAYVMPSLRKTLVQILIELEHSGIGKTKDQGARMLSRLVSSAPRLIKPYMEPILKVLVPKLQGRSTNPSVVISVLTAIGELAQVSENEMSSWEHVLFNILLEMLQDNAVPMKRQVSLWVLSQLIESLGIVGKEAYEKYPKLLELLLNFMKTEPSNVTRRETLRSLGLLGALDPYQQKIIVGEIYSPGMSFKFVFLLCPNS